MRILMVLAVLITIVLTGMIFMVAPDSTESWTAAVLLFTSNSVLWITIAASFYEHYKKAKQAQNHTLAITMFILVLATVGMAFDSFYSTVFTLAKRNIVIPVLWFKNYFDKPFAWAFSAIVYNLVAVVMMFLFQKKVFDQVLEEQEQRKQLEETKKRLEQKNQMLAIIDTVSRALNQSLDLPSILDELTHQMVLQFKIDMCTARLVTAQNDLVVEGAYGAHAQDLMNLRQAKDAGLAGWIFTQQRILQVHNVPGDHRLSSGDPLIRMGVISYVGLPLILPPREALGCLEIYSFVPREFSADEVETFTLIANTAAITIQNARNYQEAEQHRKELEALNQFSSKIDSSISESEIYQLFLNEVNKRFEVLQVIVFQKTTEDDFLEIAASLHPLTRKQAQLPMLTEPLQCRAIRTGKEVVVSNVQTDLACTCDFLIPKQGSYLCHPLIIGGKILGLVNLTSLQINYWDTDKQRVVAALAATIAPAIGNLRLMEQEKTRAITDQLTQVHNRRFLDEYLAKQIHVLKRQQNQMKTPLSILMLDLDHFKQINDSCGHEIGD